MTHSKYSPSQRARWSKCPGSILFQEDKESEYAADGTLTHSLLTKCLKDLIEPINLDTDNDRIERLTIAYNYITNRHCNWIHLEKQVSCFGSFGRFDLDGTIDMLLIGYNWIEIIDYKDGFNVVPVKNNPQLEQYACAVLSEGYECEKLTLTIIQPRVSTFNIKPIRSVTYDKAEQQEMMERLKRDIDYAQDLNKLEPGVEQCKYCSYNSKCKVLMDKCMEVVGL